MRREVKGRGGSQTQEDLASPGELCRRHPTSHITSVTQRAARSSCSFSWAVGCQGQGGGRVLQVRNGGGPVCVQGNGEEQTRLERDVEGERAELTTISAGGWEKRRWPKGDPNLGFQLGSWVVGGAVSNGEQ